MLSVRLCTCTTYGVATISSLLQIIRLFCRILSLLEGFFAKETYDFKEPTNRSHPITGFVCMFLYVCGTERERGGEAERTTREWGRFIHHFPQKSPIISGSFAERQKGQQENEGENVCARVCVCFYTFLYVTVCVCMFSIQRDKSTSRTRTKRGERAGETDRERRGAGAGKREETREETRDIRLETRA